MADVTWHGEELDRPQWDDPEARILAFTLAAVADEEAHLHVILNMRDTRHRFALPRIAGVTWYAAIDTGAQPPADALAPDRQVPVAGRHVEAVPRSVIVLEGRREGA